MVEACIEVFAKVAAERFGATDEIAVWFRGELESFFTGAVVCLDPLLSSDVSRERLGEVVEQSVSLLKSEYPLSDSGIAWVDTEIPQLAAVIRGVK